MTTKLQVRWALVAGLAATIAGAAPLAQRGGRGGAPSVPTGETRSRLEILTDVLVLDRGQRDAVRGILDAAFKAAAPVRAELAKSRAALAAAIASGRPEAEITAATQAYAEQATAMTQLEMEALAKILLPLSAEQKKQGTLPAFHLMRGIFLDDRRWDEMPRRRMY
jgi:Spy/CpxP family protein refolding chaperone